MNRAYYSSTALRDCLVEYYLFEYWRDWILSSKTICIRMQQECEASSSVNLKRRLEHLRKWVNIAQLKLSLISERRTLGMKSKICFFQRGTKCDQRLIWTPIFSNATVSPNTFVAATLKISSGRFSNFVSGKMSLRKNCST
jgi:hypothetical protein